MLLLYYVSVLYGTVSSPVKTWIYLLCEMYPELFRSKKIMLGVLVFLIFTLVILGHYRREQLLEQELVLTPAPSVYIVEKEQLRLTTPTLSAVKEAEQRSSPTPIITIKETEQQSSPSSTISTVKEQQLPSPTPTISIAEINQYFKTHPGKDHGPYIKKLSQPQIQHVITQMRISNITSENGQKQFIQCAGNIMLHNFPIKPKSDQHCKKMSFQSSGSVIALASFPGSGNSWVRQLLESATGIYSGALYCDPAYVRVGMIGEGVSTQNVIAVKTHETPADAKKLLHYDKAIYIVRSPFAAMLAFYNWQTSRANRHTLEIDPSYCSYGMKATVYWEFFKDGLFL